MSQSGGRKANLCQLVFDHSADVVVVDKLATIGGNQAFVNWAPHLVSRLCSVVWRRLQR
jgi:hypothetical protein